MSEQPKVCPTCRSYFVPCVNCGGEQPTQYGALDPQQRLDVARGEKLGADGLEICAYEREWSSAGVEPYKEKNANGRMAWPFKFKLLPLSKVKLRNDDVELCRLTDAQRLLSQRDQDYGLLQLAMQGVKDQLASCERALAQRDARIVQLEAEAIYTAAGVADDYKRIKALESQQAASVGGEREADQFGDAVDLAVRFASDKGFAIPISIASEMLNIARAALSPAGGGVVMPVRYESELFPKQYRDGWNACLEQVARLNAKPQDEVKP